VKPNKVKPHGLEDGFLATGVAEINLQLKKYLAEEYSLIKSVLIL
jgi:hypothetical protein